MKKSKRNLNNFQLILFFVLVVFFILVTTMLFIFIGMRTLMLFGIREENFTHAPVLAFAIATIIVGSVIAGIFSHIPLSPIHEIIGATNRLATGDFKARINIRGPREFKQLTESFNHMASELDSIEMLRDDFVNNFSHEFKTPIVSIRGFARLLRDDQTLTEKERQEYLTIIIDESERLSDLSTSILSLSKIENQRILTDVSIVNLTEQVRLVIVLLENKWQEKNLEIDYQCQNIEIYGNVELLQHVWINLLDNAIKFADSESTLTIKIREENSKVFVSIKNHGVPIPLDKQSRIFDKFYQADDSHATKGNGLGLTLVKRIVDLHNGSISYVSKENGETEFEVGLLKEELALGY